MKKMIGLAICILMLSALCVPAFAGGNGPVEYAFGSAPNPIIRILNGENYIISSGKYTVGGIHVMSGGTLTIGKDASVLASAELSKPSSGSSLTNAGTINVLGALSVTSGSSLAANNSNSGTIRVAECCHGSFVGNVRPNSVISVPHIYENGVCMGCGREECLHKNGFTNGKCNDCQYECPHEGYVCDTCGSKLASDSVHTGSTLSEGSLTIVVGVAAAVIFGLGGFLLGTKKKSAVADAENTENE